MDTQRKTMQSMTSEHGTFSEIYHILGHKTKINKFKRIGITSSMSTDHSGIKVEINNSRKFENITYM